LNEEELLQTWTVGTTDISARVAAAIGGPDESLVMAELRSIRMDLSELKRTNDALLTEVARLRMELAGRTARRTVLLSPYSPTEGLARVN
jgi:hypothetical protein